MDRYQEEIRRVVATKVKNIPVDGFNGAGIHHNNGKISNGNGNGIVRGSVANARVR